MAPLSLPDLSPEPSSLHEPPSFPWRDPVPYDLKLPNVSLQLDLFLEVCNCVHDTSPWLPHGHPNIPGQTEGRGPILHLLLPQSCPSQYRLPVSAQLLNWKPTLHSPHCPTSKPKALLSPISSSSKSLQSAISFHLYYQHPGPSRHPFLPELLQQPPNWSCWFHFHPCKCHSLRSKLFSANGPVSHSHLGEEKKKKPHMAH